MESKTRLPYRQEVDSRYLRHVRMLRDKTQSQLGELMGVDASTISKLERQELAFTPIYQERFKQAMKRLRVSGIELASIRKILEMKELRRYK